MDQNGPSRQEGTGAHCRDLGVMPWAQGLELFLFCLDEVFGAGGRMDLAVQTNRSRKSRSKATVLVGSELGGGGGAERQAAAFREDGERREVIRVLRC